MPRACAYFQCKNTYGDKNKSFFIFPTKHSRRLKEWIKNCGDPALDKYPLLALRSKSICIDHFEEKFIRHENAKRKRLSPLAVPIPYTGDGHLEISQDCHGSRRNRYRNKWALFEDCKAAKDPSDKDVADSAPDSNLQPRLRVNTPRVLYPVKHRAEKPSEDSIDVEIVCSFCAECKKSIQGSVWWCLVCGGTRCGGCAGRMKHRPHYMLRAPRHATHEQTRAVIVAIREQLREEELLIAADVITHVDQGGEDLDETQEPEVKIEPEEVADLLTDDSDVHSSDRDDLQHLSMLHDVSRQNRRLPAEDHSPLWDFEDVIDDRDDFLAGNIPSIDRPNDPRLIKKNLSIHSLSDSRLINDEPIDPLNDHRLLNENNHWPDLNNSEDEVYEDRDDPLADTDLSIEKPNDSLLSTDDQSVESLGDSRLNDGKPTDEQSPYSPSSDEWLPPRTKKLYRFKRRKKKSIDDRPHKKKSVDRQPSKQKSVHPKPTYRQPKDRPMNHGPPEEKSVDSQPTYRQPKDKPIDDGPPEEKSVDHQPSTEKMVYPKPTYTYGKTKDKPIDHRPPVEESVHQHRPSEEKSVHPKPTYTYGQIEGKSIDHRPPEEKSIDRRPPEGKSIDRPATDKFFDGQSVRKFSFQAPSSKPKYYRLVPATGAGIDYRPPAARGAARGEARGAARGARRSVLYAQSALQHQLLLDEFASSYDKDPTSLDIRLSRSMDKAAPLPDYPSMDRDEYWRAVGQLHGLYSPDTTDTHRETDDSRVADKVVDDPVS